MNEYKIDSKVILTDYVCYAAIDLIERMLDLDPDTRITAEQALSHDYLKQYSDPSDEPTSQPYDQSFEEKEYDVPQWKSVSAFISIKHKLIK